MTTKYINKTTINKLLKEHYLIVELIGSGSFGEVYLAEDKKQKKYALKIEGLKKTKLSKEYKVYKDMKLANVYNVPKVHQYLKTDDYNILVMDLLGPSLEELFTMYDKHLSLFTVLKIGVCIIDVIRDFHNAGYVHRDIKPNNFLVGRFDKAEIIYIMDFGLSKKYINNGKHIEESKINSVIGTPRYVSINVHNGIEPSRRDDLESICYMLIYFIKGKLPWQDIKTNKQEQHNEDFKKNTKQNKYSKIGEIKSNISTTDLTIDLPSCFKKSLDYIKQLSFEETPDYEYIKSLFQNTLNKNTKNTQFPWISQ